MNNGFNKRNNSKNKIAKILTLSVTVLVAVVLAVLFFKMGMFSSESVNANADKKIMSNANEVFDVDYTDISDLEMRGMWIASVINIDYPSKMGLSKKQLEGEIEHIVEKAYSLGINSIFFQVRPASDALYKSDIFPQSKYVSGIQGEDVSGFDSLSYIIETAKEYNIDVHAWINPYRVCMYENDMDELSAKNPAAAHPEYTVKYADGKTYYNPGLPGVRKLVVDGVKEIAEKYPDIAGIHFDDYFYPYPVANEEFDDSEAYDKYSNGLSLDDWRRSNVNALVRESYNAVKEINKDLRFGVSVFGIWANEGSDTPVKGSKSSGLEAYSETYCDALAWAKGKYVDYIIPQNYWSFDTKAAPFDDIARWWNANLDGTGVELYMGHAAYKSAEYDEGELYRQVEFCRTLSSYKGSVFYGYENISKNIGNAADDIQRLFDIKIFKNKAVAKYKDIEINFPQDNEIITTDKTYIIGSCDPSYPLYLNGEAVSKTTDGYFGVYVDVKDGENLFAFSQNNTAKNLVVKKNIKQDKITSSKPRELDGMEISQVYPNRTTWIEAGKAVNVSCVAPKGSVVKATLGNTTVSLQPTVFQKGEGKYLYEKYTGKITPSVLVSDTGFKVLGNVEFSAVLGEESAKTTGGEVAQRGIDSYVYAEVKTDYTHTKVGTNSSFYDDFLPSSKGMRDYVTRVEDGFCKLRFGGYIAEENLEFTYGKPLLLNTILTTAVEVNIESSLNNKANSTDIRFGVTENIPVDVDFRGENGEMRIIIYNTDTSIIPQFSVPENPLIKSIEGRLGTRSNMLMYYVTLKDNTNFYGFRIVYENGCMIVKLNNPQTLAQGEKPLTGKRIVVDAGHGGTDGGAPGPGKVPEKELNQRIATHLSNKLRELGATVVESRPDDTTVDLYARMDILTYECPDMAVSVHHNSIAGYANALKTRGFMALYSNNSGVSLSNVISDVVCMELGREQKPTAYQQLAVARNHMFPSTLLEMCFISNVEEYQWSIGEGNDEKSANAIVNGILEYYKNQEKYLDY